MIHKLLELEIRYERHNIYVYVDQHLELVVALPTLSLCIFLFNTHDLEI